MATGFGNPRTPWPNRPRALAGCLGAILVLALACGRVHEPSLPESEFVAALVDAACNHTQACCEKSGFAHVPIDCAETRRSYWRAQVESAKAARALYDGVAARRCIEAWRASIAECASSKENDGSRTAACAEVYRDGKTPLGASCGSDWDCKAWKLGHSHCARAAPFEEVHYVCAATITVGAGKHAGPGDEMWTGYDCAPNLIRRDDDVCVRRAAVGEDCKLSRSYVDACEVGASCDYSNTGKCVTALPFGAECTDPALCEGGTCRHGRCVVPQNVLYCVDDENPDAGLVL